MDKIKGGAEKIGKNGILFETGGYTTILSDTAISFLLTNNKKNPPSEDEGFSAMIGKYHYFLINFCAFEPCAPLTRMK